MPVILSRFAFEDSAGVMGKVAYDAGLVYQLVDNAGRHNGSAMVRALHVPMEKLKSYQWLRKQEVLHFAPEQLHTAIARMDELLADLDKAKPADHLVLDEYRMAMRLWQHGCKRLAIAEGDTTYSSPEMAAELRQLREDYQVCWLARNRPGGLSDSLTRLDRLFADYEQVLAIAP